ncbi:multiple epidermal growth factor-like domains protein 11 [Takifugu flavidus]|uniref:multiple epidermal growth factor-like domains protein 11 n=1 Tax=Takifugu flavidus TaxID=433684 RepID=UPI00254430C5|nr:multiple epidermal growth factor-like domains protein 11 [Takifugu flavidus]
MTETRNSGDAVIMCCRKLTHPLCFSVSGIFVLLLTQCGLSSELSGVTTELGHGKDVDVCPEGKYFSHQFCLECPSGHYCPGKASAPRRCPPGTFNLHTGKSTLGDCKPCFPGLISSEDKVDCRLCPAGFQCDPATGTLSLCPSGQYSPEGVLKCLSCPVDSVCPSGFPIKCGPGKEPNIEKTSCNDCLPGFYSTVCTIQCLECPAGSHCPHSGMSQPLPCPLGWSSAPGQKSCHGCNDSSLLCGGVTFAAPRWSQPAIRSSQTIICRPGTYKDIKEGMTCVICPAGHYCVGGVAIPCPAGTYGAQEGLQNLRECTICPAGMSSTVFTVWKAAHRDPPPTSCAHRGFSVKRAPLALTGHLARLVLQGNNWVRQVGQPVRDVKKDGSVLQVQRGLDCPVLGEDIVLPV